MSQHGAQLVSLPMLATVTMPVITLALGGRALAPWPLPHTQHNGWPVDLAIWPAKCPSCWGCMCLWARASLADMAHGQGCGNLPASSGLGQCGRGAVVSGAVCSQRGAGPLPSSAPRMACPARHRLPLPSQPSLSLTHAGNDRCAYHTRPSPRAG